MANPDETRAVGAIPSGHGAWEFVLWAPKHKKVCLQLLPARKGARERMLEMKPLGDGFHSAKVESLAAQARYRYRISEGRDLPDPASRFQPEGVFGPSEVFDPAEFNWADQAWKSFSLEKSVFYELHVGTFTPEGTFDAVIPRLATLAELGVTTIEIMPVGQFSGERNWGYDGVFPFAAQNSYGGPRGLQRLVDAAHRAGLAVALDVVYNHLGPEGNWLREFGPYFSTRYHTPWGDAVNLDDADSGPVRSYFIQNALMWIEQFHVDVLRLDAIHGIFDFSARHFLEELAETVEERKPRLGRQVHLVAESDLNDARVLQVRDRGGFQMDAQWSDDFHHGVHTLLTGETAGYYQDFGRLDLLARTLREGWCYSGQYSQYRRRNHGNSPRGLAAHRFVVCTQNHDQVGNRAMGERLSTLVGFESLKLAAGITLLSPFVPLLFMGEEYGEINPFQFFTSYRDAELVEAVRQGRRRDLEQMGWHGDVADPQAEATFQRSCLDWAEAQLPRHAALRNVYARLLEFRRQHALGEPAECEVLEDEASESLAIVRRAQGTELAMLFHFGESRGAWKVPLGAGTWRRLLDSAIAEWMGPGSSFPTVVESRGAAALELQPRSFVVLARGERNEGSSARRSSDAS